MARGRETDAEMARVRSGEKAPYKQNRTGSGPVHNEIDGFHGSQKNKTATSPGGEKGSRKGIYG